jgi:hypothetical protein
MFGFAPTRGELRDFSGESTFHEMSGARRGSPYDFAVYQADGGLTALFEAKLRFHADVGWARAWRSATLEGRVPADVHTFLVLPDRVFGWPPGAPPSAEPEWSIDAAPLLGPYFTRLKIPVSEAHPSVFESIVGLWLQDLVHGDVDAPELSTLLHTLRGGEVVAQVAA